MSQKEIEVILSRELASCLAVPIFIVDPDGTLIYYNEPAEAVLGSRFAETGEMPADVWGTIFMPTDEAGESIPPEELPLSVALAEQRPTHGDIWIRGLDGARHHIEITAYPLIGIGNRSVGGVAMFWEPENSERQAVGHARLDRHARS